MRAVLVAGEMAVAMMLLIGAGLLIQSFIRLEHVAPGFEPDRILSMRSRPEQSPNTKIRRRLPLPASMKYCIGSRRCRELCPPAPFNSRRWADYCRPRDFGLPAGPLPTPSEAPVTGVSIVTPGYFATMGIPLLSGRLFTGARSGRHATGHHHQPGPGAPAISEHGSRLASACTASGAAKRPTRSSA